MKSDSPFPPLKSWQFFHASAHVLGMNFLTRLFSRSSRQIYRWAADPDFTSSDGHERNPLDRLQALLSRLCEIGRQDVARAAVAILAETVGCELVCSEEATPDHRTIEAHCLDDHVALIKFHEAARSRKPKEVIRYLWGEAKGQLNKTLVKACEEGT